MILFPGLTYAFFIDMKKTVENINAFNKCAIKTTSKLNHGFSLFRFTPLSFQLKSIKIAKLFCSVNSIKCKSFFENFVPFDVEFVLKRLLWNVQLIWFLQSSLA